MRDSVKSKILRRIRGKGRGSVWAARDFRDLGGPGAVDRALSRLAQDGSLRRLSRGVYDYPKAHPRLGILHPNIDRVAQAIARKNGSQKLQVSGPKAANALGISTQVPAKTVYLTDGYTRDVRVLGQVIQFRHRTPRSLAGAGTAGGLVLQAFDYLGPDGVTPDVVQKLGRTLSAADKDQLEAVVTDAPVWAQQSLSRILQTPSDHP